MTITSVSYILLWIVQAATVVAVVALARQVGLLHLRLRPYGEGSSESGPPIGVTMSLGMLPTLGGSAVAFTTPNELSAYIFVNVGCSLCGPVLRGADALGRIEHGVRFLAAVDQGNPEGLKYVRKYGFGDALDSKTCIVLAAENRPFVTCVTSEGRVVASGVVNTLEQLEEFVARAQSTSQDFVASDFLETSGSLPNGGSDVR
jgi:hypothetical protein